MNLLRQTISFGAVGALATLTHVGVAWALIGAAHRDPYLSNLYGACAAFIVSFGGNACFTFDTNRSLTSSARRYFFVSLFSLVMTSAILAIVNNNGWPTYIYVIMVITTVPTLTFLMAKIWAFRSVTAKW